MQKLKLNVFLLHLPLIVLIFSPFLLCNAQTQRTKDYMYEPVSGILACFRRLNGTHQTGCSSKRGGSTGAVHFVENNEDLTFLFQTNSRIPYIPTMPVKLLTKKIMDKLKLLDNIAGLLIYDSNETLNEFSHDLQCPNEGSNVEGTCKYSWNKPGTGLLMEDIPMPVFYLKNATEVEKVKECYQKFNNFSFEEHEDRSLCALEMDSFMFAAYNTPTCIRRSNMDVNIHPVKFCDPMGDQNIWYSLFPLGNSTLTPNIVPKANMKHIIIAARLDAASLFSELTPGAESTVTALVTLLATAQLLKKMIPNYEKTYETNVVFALFNGENFDYIGSQRVFFDLMYDRFPMKTVKTKTETFRNIDLEDVSLVIEINQLAKPKDGKIHVYDYDGNPLSKKFINSMKKYLPSLVQHQGVIPPGSAQSFIRNFTFTSALVVADFGNETGFTNHYFNSIYDDKMHIDFTYANLSSNEDIDIISKDSVQVFLGSVVEALAKALYERVTDVEYTGDEVADLYVINELLHCYLEDANCSIHRAVRKVDYQKMPLSLYVGVTVSPNFITNLVGFTLVFLAGDKVDQGPCSAKYSSYVYHYFNMSESVENLNATQCYRACMNLTDAISPAFIINDYDWKSGQYSTWSESVWKDFKVRLFLKPAKSHELMTLIVGIIVVVLSFALTMFIHFKKEILFREISTTYL